MLRPTALRELNVHASAGPGFIAAASGLAHVGEHVYVIADDAHEIGAFRLSDAAPGRLTRMLPGELPTDEAERKRVKPDFESLARLPGHGGGGGALLVLGSGSRKSRHGGVLWQLGEDSGLEGEPERLDVSALYGTLESEIPDLNIEGTAVSGDRLLLFQRGNGRAAVNAVVALDLAASLAALAENTLTPDAVVAIRRYDLGEVGGVRLAFSDAAALADGRIVYSAVAEGGDDTFHDGHCAGAGVGIIEADGELGHWEPLEPAAKVEGIEARLDGRELRLLMVADADDPGRPSPLLSARLTPKRVSLRERG